MKVAGIICEYNPLHLGHGRQLRHIRQVLGADCGIVCLMSGSYVQRGQPAIFDRMLRAQAALRCGADLVLELPTTVSLSSAEGFAAGGVAIASKLCTHLSFGAETPQVQALTDTAAALLSDSFPPALRQALDRGLSFPAARQAALEAMGLDAALLKSPNNILAVEYCKAILSQGSALEPLVLHRPGSYHDTQADPENPSATALRDLIGRELPWQAYVPQQACSCFENATAHTLAAGEKAILYRLWTMSDEEFAALPYGSEGLWRKLMRESRRGRCLEEILSAVKSKRYTRSRLDRMVLCAFLGITKDLLEAPVPYVRALAMNRRGQALLKAARTQGDFPNIGTSMDSPYQALENRWSDLYGLFAQEPEAPGSQGRSRVITAKNL